MPNPDASFFYLCLSFCGALARQCAVHDAVAAIRAGSSGLRHVANGVLILTIVKVFLIDAPDLDGLVRAASFLVLGLALAGLAWINRRATMGGGPVAT